MKYSRYVNYYVWCIKRLLMLRTLFVDFVDLAYGTFKSAVAIHSR